MCLITINAVKVMYASVYFKPVIPVIIITMIKSINSYR